ncbi:MAG: hypothetical protein Q7T63_14610 [Burkholderiaceae bacterium]|nr:hypothetical protein [Burkholderiaceae bacterium]MDP3139658.1 hypothetical protein [Burkholderiaceae bacterium]
MFNSFQPGGPACVRLCVNSSQAAQGWAARLRRAGWRTFVRASDRSGSVMTCILKRGRDCVMLSQSAIVPMEQTVVMPADVAGELCSLFVESGLAVPA